MRSLVLASASPRRKELLEQLGYRFSLLPVDIDETPEPQEIPADYLPRMSKTKALEAGKRCLTEDASANTLVLASDTSVIIDNQILGKPKDQSDFFVMMNLLSGNWHQVMTSIALLDLNDNANKTLRDAQVYEQTVVTQVKFKELDQKEIEAYWLTGEPKDKAGGYGIQGKAAVFIEEIRGSYSNVVGLPLQETARLLTDNGLNICDIWIEAGNRGLS